MRVPEILASIVSRFIPPIPEPKRQTSTPADVRWERRQIEALRREADMLTIDTNLDAADRV